MKPTNSRVPSTPTFWCLRDERGEFYAYSTPDAGVRCSSDVNIARKYATLKGAYRAQDNICEAYGKFTKPVEFEVVIREKAKP